MKLHSHPLSLEPVAPFDFDKSLAFLAHRLPAQPGRLAAMTVARALAGENEVKGGTLTKALRVDGETVGCQLRSVGAMARKARGMPQHGRC
ncbi:hypothetical protein BH24DEI1_BH24DEI1_16120 [soil metagenome]|jgi:hypothetical protein